MDARTRKQQQREQPPALVSDDARALAESITA
jgi:hypothetical protein